MQVYAKKASFEISGVKINLFDCSFAFQKGEIKKSPFEEQIEKIEVKTQVKKESFATEEELQEGAMVFNSMCNTWAINFQELIESPFDDDVGEQPDRANLLRDTIGKHSRSIFVFIRHCGGLTHAVLQVLNVPNANPSSVQFKKLARQIAENMAQVASLLCPPLSDFLEYPWSIENE